MRLNRGGRAGGGGGGLEGGGQKGDLVPVKTGLTTEDDFALRLSVGGLDFWLYRPQKAHAV